MKLGDVLKNVNVYGRNAMLNMEISGVSCDSRYVNPGDLFIAVRGFESDGHKYIDSAYEKGAACCLCEEPPKCGIPYVITDDSRRGMALAAVNFHRNPSSRMKVIGVTGTNGKTTITTLIKAMIEDTLGAKVGLIGTIANMIGDEVIPTERTTPDCCELQALLDDMAGKGCAYVVMEVSSHALALDRVDGMTFEQGIFTNLTEDHLDFHKTMDAYAAAKSKLFTMCRRAIINIDDDYAPVMTGAAACPVDTVSLRTDAAFMADDVSLDHDGVKFTLKCAGASLPVSLGIPGQFSVYNGLTAAASLIDLGVSPEDAAAALGRCAGVKGRAEVVPTGRDFTVIIDYAHTPDALENILNTVNGFKKGRCVLLFGCGGDREHEKRPVMGSIACKMADMVIVTSDNPRTEEPGEIISQILEGMKGTATPFEVIPDRVEAIGYALKNARKDDVIVLAGKGHETYQILGKEKIHFDEREIVASWLEKLG